MTDALIRRDFLRGLVASVVVSSLPRSAISADCEFEFEISLSERSLAKSIAKQSIDRLDIARIAKKDLGISAVEYASSNFRNRAGDEKYLHTMNARAADHGVRQLLIAVENEGRIGDDDEKARLLAMQNHRKWVDAAQALGCHSIEVDPTSPGTLDQQHQRIVAALAELCEYSAKQNINILLGNYGGASASADWIVGVIRAVNLACCGTLPQIGRIANDQNYEHLASIAAFAKGITAMTFEFDDQGRETHTDYAKAMEFVQQSGYRGYVGIRYAGTQLDELAGIRATKRLLEDVRRAMTQKEDARK